MVARVLYATTAEDGVNREMMLHFILFITVQHASMTHAKIVWLKAG